MDLSLSELVVNLLLLTIAGVVAAVTYRLVVLARARRSGSPTGVTAGARVGAEADTGADTDTDVDADAGETSAGDRTAQPVRTGSWAA